MAKKKKSAKQKSVKELEYLELINIVRSRGRVRRDKINEAYNEVQLRMKPKITYIVSQFYIPGCNFDDIYQEALYALRYKAIPDYDKTKGNHGPYPFDNFAILCIRRHLSTMLKSSFQNKRKVLNTSISLDQDRNNGSEDVLLLSEILPKTEGTVLDLLENSEYYKNLLKGLFKKLSVFEKKVFLLYVQKFSYEEMTEMINSNYEKCGLNKEIETKSVDNALQRIKQKAKEVYLKYGEI